MQKYNIIKKITDLGIVAVVRANNSEEAVRISEGCMEGGINAIEVTFTVPGAAKVIERLVEKFKDKLLVGAGTVLDSETARVAILAGAKYIVSPGFDLETAKLCNRYQLPYMPGCMTITEMLRAAEAGVDIVKLFPGSAFGPSYVKAVKGPLPNISIMPTGGVDLDNVGEWIKNGCVAVGVGGNLTKGSKEDIKAVAQKYVEKIKEARSK